MKAATVTSMYRTQNSGRRPHIQVNNREAPLQIDLQLYIVLDGNRASLPRNSRVVEEAFMSVSSFK